MSVSYYYSITGSFPSSSIATTKFHDEVSGSITGSQFEYINVYGDDVNVYFSSSLGSGSLSDLNYIVSIHDGIPYSNFGYNFEDLLDLSGSRSMEGNLQMSGFPIVSASSVNSVVVESHSLRHLYTGSDEIDGDRLGIDYVPTNYTRNGSISEAGNVKDLSAHLSGIDQKLSSSLTLFGKDNFYAENSIPFSTTFNGFLTALTLNFSCSYSGYYRTGWNYIWSYDSTSFDIQVRVRLDDSVDLLFPYHTEEPSTAGGSGLGGTNQRHQNYGFKYAYFTSGSHSVDLDVRSTKSGKDATVHFSSIEIWKAQ
ncbi:MAG: hypothetical protein Q8P81_04380 [Nanoarchaeota archaeon]|nr:hypothetical protein [Nanoarchaeota archaeon]